MRDARLGGLPRHPPRRARNPNSELFSKHALNYFHHRARSSLGHTHAEDFVSVVRVHPSMGEGGVRQDHLTAGSTIS
jgi:hypothetical protein